MSRIEELADKIQNRYDQLQVKIRMFADKTKIVCKSGCGACCQRPNAVWASVGELLPMAKSILDRDADEDYRKYLTQSAIQDHDQHTAAGSQSTHLCVAFVATSPNPGFGQCREYNSRPITCRLFGSTFRSNKNSKPEFVGCDWLKAHYPSAIAKAGELMESKFLNFSTSQESAAQIRFEIDDLSLREELPINVALRKALELLTWTRASEQDSNARDCDQ